MYLKRFGGKMREIEERELEKVRGGGTSPWIGLGIGALVIFIIGVIDGYTRPLPCNE